MDVVVTFSLVTKSQFEKKNLKIIQQKKKLQMPLKTLWADFPQFRGVLPVRTRGNCNAAFLISMAKLLESHFTRGSGEGGGGKSYKYEEAIVLK